GAGSEVAKAGFRSGLGVRATSAAGSHGIAVVSRDLGLDFTRLKTRVSKGGCESKVDVPFPGDGFVDLGLVCPVAEHQPSNGCLVEIQRENGTLLRVRMGDGAFLDCQWIKDAFLQV
ncbi:MAG: hypothetical protein QM518_04715, partial [Verrucomicrobiota bacterium]|nr:hypothetical protein [Verrucomicrobiota bacterium]